MDLRPILSGGIAALMFLAVIALVVYRRHNKINMFYCSFIKGNCPVRRIIAYQCWNVKSFWEFSIYTNLIGGIQVFCKFSFDTLLSCSINKYIILNMLICFKGF